MSTDPAGAQLPPPRRVLGRIARDVTMVMWSSFLAASTATMFLFALIDPTEIAQGSALATMVTSRNAGYALGFFFIWAFTTLAAALTLYLARTETTPQIRRVTDDTP